MVGDPALFWGLIASMGSATCSNLPLLVLVVDLPKIREGRKEAFQKN